MDAPSRRSGSYVRDSTELLFTRGAHELFRCGCLRHDGFFPDQAGDALTALGALCSGGLGLLESLSAACDQFRRADGWDFLELSSRLLGRAIVQNRPQMADHRFRISLCACDGHLSVHNFSRSRGDGSYLVWASSRTGPVLFLRSASCLALPICSRWPGGLLVHLWLGFLAPRHKAAERNAQALLCAA